jgi:hypothetical protein
VQHDKAAGKKAYMAGSKPPERGNARKYTLQVGTACLFLGAVLGLTLDQLIVSGPSIKMLPFVQIFILIMVAVAEIVAILYYAWRLDAWRLIAEGTRNASEQNALAYATGTMPKDDNEVGHIWNSYIELGVMERHFNEIQSGYRRLASTWILADFAAIGFVLSTKLTLGIPTELFIAVLGIAGSVGVYLIFVLDLLVTQRLRDASFIVANDLETKHRWLSQVRTNMRLLLRGKASRSQLLFYAAGAEFMVLTSAVGLLLWLRTTSTPVGILWLVAVDYFFGMVLVLMFMRVATMITPFWETAIKLSKGVSEHGDQ